MGLVKRQRCVSRCLHVALCESGTRYVRTFGPTVGLYRSNRSVKSRRPALATPAFESHGDGAPSEVDRSFRSVHLTIVHQRRYSGNAPRPCICVEISSRPPVHPSRPLSTPSGLLQPCARASMGHARPYPPPLSPASGLLVRLLLRRSGRHDCAPRRRGSGGRTIDEAEAWCH